MKTRRGLHGGWLYTTLILVLASILSACDAFTKDEQELLDTARNYIQQRDVRAAAIELRNVLKLNSQNLQARVLLAQLNLEVGSVVVAEKEFRNAVEMGMPLQDVAVGLSLALLEQNHLQELLVAVPVAAEWPNEVRASVHAIRAAAENSLGDTDNARRSLAKAAGLVPDNVHVLASEARLLIAEDKLAQARAVLERAHALYPESQDVMFLMAGIAYKENKTGEIKEILYKIIEADLPKIVTAYEWRARLGIAKILLDEGALDESQAVIQPLMSRINRDADSLYLAAMLSFKRGEYELTVRRLHELLELEPGHRTGLLLLGSVNYFLGEYEQAAYYLSKYIASEPADMSARKLLGKAYLELEAHKELRKVLEPLLLNRQGDAEVLAMVGMSALRTGQLEAGVADIEKAVAMSPDNARLREFLARAYIIAGEPQRAIKELETVFAGGDKSDAEVLLILAHLRAGNNQAATGVAAAMARNHPNNHKVLTVAGNVFLVSGDSGQALKYFEDALKLSPEYLPAALAVARVYEHDGEFDRARKEYERLINVSENKVVTMMALANLEKRRGQTERRIYWLNEAAAQNPPQVSPRLVLSGYYLDSGKPALAKALVEEALEIEPRNLAARLLHVRALMSEQRYDQVLPILTELAEDRPESVPVSLLLAESYLRLQNIDDARLIANRILERQADSIPANMLMAATSMRAEEYPQALGYTEKLIALKPDWFKGYEMAGDVKSAMLDYSGAEQYYRKAMEREPTTGLAVKIAQTFVYRDRLDKAEAELNSWIDARGADTQSLLLLGIVHQRQAKLDEAEKIYAQVIEADANNAVALNNLAGIYDIRNDPRALATAERAYRSNPDAADIQDTYGWLLSRYGNPTEGKRLLEKALEQLPGNPEVRFHLAVATLNSGEDKAAKRLLEQLLKEGAAFVGKEQAIEIYNNIK